MFKGTLLVDLSTRSGGQWTQVVIIVVRLLCTPLVVLALVWNCIAVTLYVIETVSD